MDVYDKDKRSEVMSKVRSHGNKSTEIKLIKFFKKHNIIGWRRKYSLFGKPDFVFPKKRIIIFTDGCFWHGHNCRNTHPKNNKEYWDKKIKRNKKRDREVTKELKNKNWLVIRLWECALKNERKIKRKLKILFNKAAATVG